MYRDEGIGKLTCSIDALRYQKVTFKVNLSKFVEEIAKTIAEAKIKYGDVQSVVTISVRLACCYAEFSSLLLPEFRKVLPVKRSDKIQNPSKLRVDIR